MYKSNIFLLVNPIYNNEEEEVTTINLINNLYMDNITIIKININLNLLEIPNPGLDLLRCIERQVNTIYDLKKEQGIDYQSIYNTFVGVGFLPNTSPVTILLISEYKKSIDLKNQKNNNIKPSNNY